MEMRMEKMRTQKRMVRMEEMMMKVMMMKEEMVEAQQRRSKNPSSLFIRPILQKSAESELLKITEMLPSTSE
jgi:hypothetical protein